jgi:peptidyl-prolyl cis-trans isomerase B (cyclophilin B)
LATSETLRVLQCGDPTATGGGGPGYEFGLENVDGATYEAGTVAMARRADDPDSNGSQFFLVYEDSQLPAEYTVFGRITDGIDVLTQVAEAGTEDGSTDGAPAEPVTIDSLVTEP